MEVKWNLNGNWLLTASRDHLCKLFDIRNLKEELQVFRGHKKEATGFFKFLLEKLLSCVKLYVYTKNFPDACSCSLAPGS